ncbi:MAG TPA: SCP2 sterol-binding domain-containing protein [Myxococcota bacterium]|nr:SCP2 sterol-binding domain-containing protein [Myxococcota bacterium]
MVSSLSIADYFTAALPKILRAKGPEASGLGVNVRFVVTGRGGGTWTIRLRPPAACVVTGAEWKADLVITLTAGEMTKMLTGTFDARAALAAGNIELSGDLSVLRRIGFLLQRPTSSAQAAAAAD